MKFLACVACVLAVGVQDSEPDWAALVPFLVAEAQEVMLSADELQPVSLHVGTFVSRINRVADHPIGGQAIRDIVAASGRGHSDQRVITDCSTGVCEWLADEPFWIRLEDLQRVSDTQVSAQIRVVAPGGAAGVVANVIRYELEWDGTAWVKLEQRVLQRS